MAIILYSQHAAKVRLDLTSHILFSSILLNNAQIILCALAWIWYRWLGHVRAKCIWSGSKPACKTHNLWHKARFCQNATGTLPLPVSHFQTWLCSSTDDPDDIVQNQPWSDLVLADCQVWAKRIRPVKQATVHNRGAHFWPLLRNWFGLGVNRIWHGLLGAFLVHSCFVCVCVHTFRPEPKNEDEMMVLIFQYIDRIFSVVRPRKLLYMAIDGVVINTHTHTPSLTMHVHPYTHASSCEHVHTQTHTHYTQWHLYLHTQMHYMENNFITVE